LETSAGLHAVAKREDPCLCRESYSGRPSRSLLTVLTKLSWVNVDNVYVM